MADGSFLNVMDALTSALKMVALYQTFHHQQQTNDAKIVVNTARRGLRLKRQLRNVIDYIDYKRRKNNANLQIMWRKYSNRRYAQASY
jgi:hypothetical protein